MQRLSLWGRLPNGKSQFYAKGGQLGDVEAITPVSLGLGPSDIAYLGLTTLGGHTWLVYQVGELDAKRWKPLLRINRTRSAHTALRELRAMYGSNTHIKVYNVLDTFKYLYGYKPPKRSKT